MATRAKSVAVIDGHAISEAELETVRTQFGEAFGQQLTSSQTLDALLVAPFVVDYVTATKKWAPDAAYADNLAKLSNPDPLTVTLLKYAMAQNTTQLGQADVATILGKLRAANIQVNPRFGNFVIGNDGLGLALKTPNWIKESTPAATTTAPAS